MLSWCLPLWLLQVQASTTTFPPYLLDHVAQHADAGRVEVGFGHACSQHGLCDSCIADSCGWCDREQRCLGASATCGPGHAPVSVNLSSCPPQVPRQTDFRRQDALEMVRYAWAAYYDEPERHGLPDSAEVVKPFHYRIGIWDNAFAYVALDSSANRIVLAFRGTDTLTQLMVELISHSLVPFMTGNAQVRVNEFFLAAADDLLPQLTPVLRDLEIKCPTCQLWITGHSLGASMALLAAFNVSFWTREEPILVTFGQPRSVNGPFARMMEKRLSRIYRLVNARDPVPHIPRCHRSDAALKPERQYCRLIADLVVRACARRFLRRNSWHHSAFSPRNSKQFPQSQFDMPWMVSVRSSPLSRFRCCILAAEFFGGFHFFEPLGTESAPKSYRIYRDKPRPLVPGRAFAAPAAFRLGEDLVERLVAKRKAKDGDANAARKRPAQVSIHGRCSPESTVVLLQSGDTFALGAGHGAPSGFRPLRCGRCGELFDLGKATFTHDPKRFWCPKCRFRAMDPFNEVVDGGLLHLCLVTAAEHRFTLSLPLLKEWRAAGEAVWVRMVALDCVELLQVWPEELSLEADGRELFRIAPPEKGHRRRDVPQELTYQLMAGPNVLQLRVNASAVGSGLALGVLRCSAKAPRRLCGEVPRASAAEAREQMRVLLREEDDRDDLQFFASKRLSLLCPISLERLERPVRGRRCRHMRCFGLSAYCRSNHGMDAFNNRWTCPVCTERLRPADLVVDGYVEQILAETEAGCEEVILSMDGSWCPAIDTDEAD
ncbi:pli1, partial [Symbiodinium microadriaticum]